MKIVAVGVLVLGVALMSAPLVLPRLGLTGPGAAPARPAAGVGLADLGRALTDGMASVRGYLGASGAAEGARLPQPGSAGQGDVPARLAAARLAAACAELARAAQADPAACAAAAGSGAGFGPAATAGAATGATAAAATRGTGAPVARRQAAGAKFVRVDKATP